jgi:hypothetical protein
MHHGSGERSDDDVKEPARETAPLPSMAFRRRAWLEFQRALDPLAPPKPLKLPRQH